MANIAKLPLFCRCVIQNFPFIEEDFDALTNYELICKVVEYLNKVIASQNEVIDVANNLSESFQQLHDYVANYFDNLDVQEEINNKLDAMVEAGTLQEIIGAYLNATAVWGFDTVADMKSSTNLINGSFAKTLGFNAKNDGGGSNYKIRTITNEDVVNNATLIALSDNTLVAELIPSDTLSVKQIGGFSTVADTTSILNIGFAYCYEKKITFLIDDALTFDTPIVVENVPNIICTQALNYIGSENTIALSLGTTESEQNMLKLDLMIKNGTKSNTIVGVKLININSSDITIRYLYQFGTGLIISGNGHGSCYNIFNLLTLFYNDTAIKCISENSGWVNDNLFNGGKIQYRNSEDYSATIGVELIGTDTRRINNNVFMKPTFEYLNTGVKIVYGTGNEVYNGRFENVNYAGNFDANSRVNVIDVGYGNTGYISAQATNTVTSTASNSMLGKVKICDIDIYANSTIEDYQGTNRLTVTNYIIMNQGGSTTDHIASDGNYELANGYFVQKVSQKGFGVFVDARVAKKFYLRKDTALGYAGRYVIKLYDESKTAISTSTIGSLDGSAALLTTNDISNSFRNSVNMNTDFVVNIPEAAKYVFIGGTKVGDDIKIKRLEIYSDQPATVKTSLSDFS